VLGVFERQVRDMLICGKGFDSLRRRGGAALSIQEGYFPCHNSRDREIGSLAHHHSHRRPARKVPPCDFSASALSRNRSCRVAQGIAGARIIISS